MKFAVAIAFTLLVCVFAQEEEEPVTCGGKQCKPNSCCVQNSHGKGKDSPRCHPLGKLNNPCEVEPNENGIYSQHCPCGEGLSCTKVGEPNKLRCQEESGKSDKSKESQGSDESEESEESKESSG
uniref:U33-theraphotoxin-Cg1c n=1 Tax=Chilobrachys guangxiensis TaxID=278060 RepID=JZT70_CHIGU|nr:RecName: Full=U33-theraphotoxin-Cg1c; Short=U33-TRTX-Cg1c; AltName: Full=Jingzhaotoxin-70; Short=JZTX-70; Flags: Precursor [Chilobrachys guangxiensis]ABY71741.1 cystine knot toxin [Chilobrachys guangxiensis]